MIFKEWVAGGFQNIRMARVFERIGGQSFQKMGGWRLLKYKDVQSFKRVGGQRYTSFP